MVEREEERRDRHPFQDIQEQTGLGPDVERKTAASELGSEAPKQPQPASNLHTRIVVLFCEGVRRGAGERWRERGSELER